MELGTNMVFEKILDLPSAVKKTAEAGFKFVDFDLTRNAGFGGGSEEEEIKYFTRLNEIIKGYGVSLYQAHAPYIRFNSENPDDLFNPEYIESQIKAIKRAKLLNVKYLVYHPYIPYPKNKENVPYDYSVFAEANFERNVKFFKLIKPYLQEYGIRGAIENCYAYDWTKRAVVPSACSTSDELLSLVNAVGDDVFYCCLDVGHLNLINGESVESFILKAGKRLKVLHLNDNFGAQNDWFGEMDRHLPPFFGCVDWKVTVKALRKIEFDGVFSFEVNPYGPLEQLELENVMLYKAGKYMLENF